MLFWFFKSNGLCSWQYQIRVMPMTWMGKCISGFGFIIGGSHFSQNSWALWSIICITCVLILSYDQCSCSSTFHSELCMLLTIKKMYIVQAYSIHVNCYMARTDNLAVVKMINFLLLSCWYLGLQFGASPVSSSHKQETVKCTMIIDYSNQNFDSLLPGSSFCCVNRLLSLFLKIFVNWKVKPLNWSISLCFRC